MRILGIDPGTITVGYGCLEIEERAARAGPIGGARIANLVRGPGQQKVRVVEAGALSLGRGSADIADRLLRLADGIVELVKRLAPAELALEEAFFGRSVQSALRIGEARGVVMAEARRLGVAVYQFSPARVKRSLTGHGAAGKSAVAAMAQTILGLAEIPKPQDITDALAVALCRYESRRTIHGMEDCNPSVDSIESAPGSRPRRPPARTPSSGWHRRHGSDNPGRD